MKLADYFSNNSGRGVLATADAEGKVDIAIYAKPHVMADGSLAFIMAEHRTHANIQVNGQACYLFQENGSLSGIRLYLTKTNETDDPALVDTICRTCRHHFHGDGMSHHVVFFKIDEQRPLFGD